MIGYRNLVLGIGALALMAEIAWVAGPEHVTELGSTYTGIGLTMGAIIGGRALNKMAVRNGNGQGDAGGKSADGAGPAAR